MKLDISKKRKFITIIAINISGIVLVFIGFTFYRAYSDIEKIKDELGYKSPYKDFLSPVFGIGEWKRILIDADIAYTDGAHNIVPHDLDNDGNMELIANSYRSDALIVYKYNSDSNNSSNWSKYVIDSSVGGGIPRRPIIEFAKSSVKVKLLGGFIGGAHYTAISDINRNGTNDLVVAGDLKRYDVVWYEVPEDITKISSWRKHIIYKNDSHRTYHIEIGDIDGDGEEDIVFATKTDNSVGWLKNNRSFSEWPLTWVDNNCIRCFNVRVADIDNNGQNDIIASEDDSHNGGKLHLYSYLNNPVLQENWIDCAIANFQAGHGVNVFEIIDIDSDDDLDVVTGNHQGDVYILENPYPNNVYEEWNKYKVNNYNVSCDHDFREIDIGDIDSDRDLDIIVADEGGNLVMWFENSGMIFNENWNKHLIDKSNKYLRWCHCVETGDIDRDGDLDVAVAAAGSNTFLIYLNNMKDS